MMLRLIPGLIRIDFKSRQREENVSSLVMIDDDGTTARKEVETNLAYARFFDKENKLRSF